MVVIVVIMIMLAVLVNLVPGDPARIILGTHATPQLIAQVRSSMGLDNPVYVQVWDFIWQALHGNFGTDFISQAPVSSEIASRCREHLHPEPLPASCLGGRRVLLGIAAAVRRGGIVDTLVRGTSVVLLSVLRPCRATAAARVPP